MLYYRLDDNGKPYLDPTQNKDAWDDWRDHATNVAVALSRIGASTISTVFNGMAHDEKNPLLWETAVVGGPLHLTIDHCGGSREQAEMMHDKMVQRVKDLLPKPKQ